MENWIGEGGGNRRCDIMNVDHGLRLIVYDPTQEVIERWIN
jgi:hypothetical protein